MRLKCVNLLVGINDSQELVADYDDRSEFMRELQLKTMISPSQDLVLHSNNTMDDAPLFDSTVYINPDLIQYDSQELVAD